MIQVVPAPTGAATGERSSAASPSACDEVHRAPGIMSMSAMDARERDWTND